MTKKKIYQSALKLFEEEGYDNTTVEKIVKEAGVSKGSFFVYFPKKDYVVLQYFKDLEIYSEEMAKDIDANETESPTWKIMMFFIRSIEKKTFNIFFVLSLILNSPLLRHHSNSTPLQTVRIISVSSSGV